MAPVHAAWPASSEQQPGLAGRAQAERAAAGPHREPRGPASMLMWPAWLWVGSAPGAPGTASSQAAWVTTSAPWLQQVWVHSANRLPFPQTSSTWSQGAGEVKKPQSPNLPSSSISSPYQLLLVPPPSVGCYLAKTYSIGTTAVTQNGHSSKPEGRQPLLAAPPPRPPVLRPSFSGLEARLLGCS